MNSAKMVSEQPEIVTKPSDDMAECAQEDSEFVCIGGSSDEKPAGKKESIVSKEWRRQLLSSRPPKPVVYDMKLNQGQSKEDYLRNLSFTLSVVVIMLSAFIISNVITQSNHAEFKLIPAEGQSNYDISLFFDSDAKLCKNALVFAGQDKQDGLQLVVAAERSALGPREVSRLVHGRQLPGVFRAKHGSQLLQCECLWWQGPDLKLLRICKCDGMAVKDLAIPIKRKESKLKAAIATCDIGILDAALRKAVHYVKRMVGSSVLTVRKYKLAVQRSKIVNGIRSSVTSAGSSCVTACQHGIQQVKVLASSAKRWTAKKRE